MTWQKIRQQEIRQLYKEAIAKAEAAEESIILEDGNSQEFVWMAQLAWIRADSARALKESS